MDFQKRLLKHLPKPDGFAFSGSHGQINCYYISRLGSDLRDRGVRKLKFISAISCKAITKNFIRLLLMKSGDIVEECIYRISKVEGPIKIMFTVIFTDIHSYR